MFTKIRVKNYKSLVNLTVNLEKKKSVAKNLAIIYGENGVGKSNLASVFDTLLESIDTLSIRKRIQSIFDNEKVLQNKFYNFMINGVYETEKIIQSCKTINSSDNMELEFWFTINGKSGIYLLSYNNKKIVKEKLTYSLNGRKCTMFDIEEDSVRINKNIFLDNLYKKEIEDLILRYEGKHTLLAILKNEIDEKSSNFFKTNVDSVIEEIILFFSNISVNVKKGNKGEKGVISLKHPILSDLSSGVIETSASDKLNKAEELLNSFFVGYYSDIKEVYYKTNLVEDNKIHYALYFKKKIGGEIIDINADLESTGTQKLIDILPFLLTAVAGNVVVIDELDLGIHDLLVTQILSDIVDSIHGQLIITTHNTMLLESNIRPEYLYTFVVDQNANKELVSIIEFEDRSHPNYNYRSRYLKGLYGGIPYLGNVDFEDLLDIFK